MSHWVRQFPQPEKNTMVINAMSQDVEGVGSKQTFVWVDEDSVSGKAS